MGRFVAAIDQGTTSTRCIVFDRAGIVGSAQKEHRQIYPKPGWVEHDPDEIWKRTCQVVNEALAAAKASSHDIQSIGITNQRESTLVWNRKTARPYGNAMVWQDTRTKEICDALTGQASEISTRSGLPVATYFSAPKLRWMLDNDSQLKRDAQNGDAIFGTIDTWLIWYLTGQHLTDATNASRTMLMNLRTLEWDDELLKIFDIPRAMLPRIVPSVLGDDAPRTSKNSPFGADVPIHGILGDQQAALFGQCCFSPGQAKNTYGTGCFLLMNVGEKPVISNSGLLTTVGYQLADGCVAYALEGSIAIAGALVQWLRDNLGIIQSSDETEALARSVPDNGGVYFVPAFSGLFAPHWRSDARGTIVGLSAHSSRAHLARAALEATAYQTSDVVDAITKDSGTALKELKVDGGMTRNELLMQFQADILNVPVSLPTISETTALGAAYAAGLGSGYFRSLNELRLTWKQSRRWTPAMVEQIRANLLRHWRKAIERSLEWID